MKFAQVRNVPDIRFKNFSGYWSFKPLSYFALQVKNKNTNQAESYVLTNSAKFGIVGQEEYFDREIAKNDNLAKYYVVHVGDFIYNPRKSAFASAGPIKRNRCAKGVISPIYTVFHISKGNPDFFEQYFHSTKWQQYMKSIANYGARFDRLNITRTDFFNLPLPCISEEEQQKIASFLSSVDTKIEQLGKKKTLLEQYKKGMMQKLFSQETRFKDEWGNSYSLWGERKFSCIAEKVNDNYKPTNSGESFECIELESLSSETGLLIRTFRSGEQKSIKTKFLTGDVLFGKLRPYLKKFYRTDFDGVCTSEIWVLRPKSVPSEFLFYVVQSHHFNRVANIQSGSKMPRSDWGIVSQSIFEIPFDYDEQRKIADFLSAIDKKIELVVEQLEQVRTYKKGLLQRMFI